MLASYSPACARYLAQLQACCETEAGTELADHDADVLACVLAMSSQAADTHPTAHLQLRVVQKVLLARLKSETPSDMGTLPVLMDACFDELAEASASLVQTQQQLHAAAEDLQRAIALTLHCLRYATVLLTRGFTLPVVLVQSMYQQRPCSLMCLFCS